MSGINNQQAYLPSGKKCFVLPCSSSLFFSLFVFSPFHFTGKNNNDDKMNNKDNIKVFSATNVVVSRIGNSGEETYEPANVDVYACKKRDMKGWIVSRNLAGNVLVFNAIIPGNCPVLPSDRQPAVRIGKIPSLSYLNADDKPIPTIWKFLFKNYHDFEFFFGLMLVFSRLGHEVNANGAMVETHIGEAEIRKILAEESDEDSVDLLASESDEDEDKIKIKSENNKKKTYNNNNNGTPDGSFKNISSVQSPSFPSPAEGRFSGEMFSPMTDTNSPYENASAG